MNNSFLSILQENLKKIFLQECTIDILTKDQSLAHLFLQICKDKDLSAFLTEIYNQLPANDETLDIRWSLQSFIGILQQQNSKDLSEEIAMRDFSSINDQALNVIKKYINFEGEINDGTAHDISFYIQLLRDEFPGIFYSILTNLQGIISKIRSERIYKAIGSNLMSFCINPPIDFFNQITEFDEQELPSFFQFHTNFTQPELTISLETKISESFPYPTLIKGLQNSIDFTLVNSSLCKKQIFIDMIYELVDKALSSETNSNDIKNLSDPVLDFFPYFIVANQTVLLREKNQYLQNLLKILDSDSPQSQNIKRFKEDFKFLNFISNQTGKNYGYGDLFIDSFPFLLKKSIQNTEKIVNFSKSNFFSIKDDQRDNDFDFTRCYGIFYLILSFIKNNNQNPNQTQLNNALSTVKKLLNDITNEKIKSTIIIDLFSCVFIEDKTHQFICHPIIAHQIILTLLSFHVPNQFYRANALFNNNRPTKNDISIAPWFNNDTCYIYSAIESKNWNLAEKLTAYLPYFIKLYTEAMQADKYLNEKDEHVENYIKINALLSTITEKDKLKEYQGDSKLDSLTNTIIDDRIQKAADPEILCSVFEDENKYRPINEFSVEFDGNFETSLKKIKNYPQNHFITDESNSLDKFLNYLYKYYRCAILIDSTTFDSIEDLFKFNFQRAIEGSILHDEMSGAEELTKCVNIDLFNHIFENLSSFTINSNFIENLSKKFPLESAALSISNHVEANLPPKLKSIYNYFSVLQKQESQETLNEQTINNDDDARVSIDSILTPDFNDFEDVIFLVDHNELYSQMMLRFDNETIATNYYKVFSFVSYVAPESDQSRLKSIEVFYHIIHISDKKDPIAIINDLYEKGQNYFSLIIDYISYWVPQSEQISLIFKLINLSAKNDLQIDLILEAFPDHFDVIMARLYYLEGFLLHLIKYAPSCKVQFLEAVSLLPKQIFNDCNIFDIDSIARAYIRYPIKILEIGKQIAEYFTDDHLLMIAQGTAHSQYSNHICIHLYQFFDDKNKIIDFWSEVIDAKLMKIVVDSESKEFEVTKFFNLLYEPFNSIDHVKFKQYLSLSHLVEMRPFLRYQITYSFTKLREPDFFNEILSVCNKMDNESIIFDISESFGMELDNFYFSRANLQLILGDISGSVETIQKENLKIDHYSHQQFYDSSYYFLYPLSKNPIFQYKNKNNNNEDDKNDNKSELPLSNEEDELFNSSLLLDDAYKSITDFLKRIPKGVKKKVTNFSSPEAKNTLILFISKHCSIGPALSLLISFLQLDLAYDLLNTIENREEKIYNFIHNVCLPVVFNNLDTKFMDFIMKIDKKLEKTRFLWDAAIDFFTKKEMPQGLIFALQIENKLEDAAIVAFESLKSSVSYLNSVTILGNIIINLKSSINYRNTFLVSRTSTEYEDMTECDDEQDTPTVVINESKTYDEIEEYLTIAELQLSVYKFCIEKKAQFTHNYDLFSSKSSADSVAAHLFINKQYELMKEIKDSMKLSKTEILCKASDLVCKESPDRIIKFARNLNNEDRLDFLKALAMTNNRVVFFSVMYDCFDKKEQQHLFLDYNFIVDSFALAYASRNTDIIPLIAHKAALLGDTRTVHECEKIMNQT